MQSGHFFSQTLSNAVLALLLFLIAMSEPMHAGLYEQLENVVDQKMAETGVPGLLMGVWRGNTEIAVFEKGFSNIHTSEPIDRLDTLRIASVTKSFTVTRILQLRDEGLLSLDEPISNYVTGLQNGNASLRQLANMTSGIFNYTEDPDVVSQLITNPTKNGRIWNLLTPPMLRSTHPILPPAMAGTTPIPTRCCWAWSLNP